MTTGRNIQPGDAFTFIYDVAIIHEDTGKAAVIGDCISRWFATNEPGCVFKITAARGTTYETMFVGFQVIDQETGAISIQPTIEVPR